MKPKAKTLIEKMGFVDQDMQNSDHDTIVEWIDENSDELISRFIEIDHEKNKNLIMKWNTKYSNMFSEHGTWEKVVTKGNYIIGFIDYHKGFYPGLFKVYNTDDSNTHRYCYKHNFYFEAKTSIPSMGELLRQIQFYKNNLIKCRTGEVTYHICIVSYPNPRAQKIVEAQGFVWIDYPGEKPQGKSKGQKTLF